MRRNQSCRIFLIVILVLADDFSGAAEMAGIAHQMGCSAEIHTSPQLSSLSEVIAIDTHTRALGQSEAIAKLEQLLPVIRSYQASWVFKKVDSVLRGHVLAESEVLIRGLGMQNGILISANPSKNRIVQGGEYFVDGSPLHETLFARDPVFPATTSNVVELLGISKNLEISGCPLDKSIQNQKGLFVPDVSSTNDVDYWSDRLTFKTLTVGGVDFFSSLIKTRLENLSSQYAAQKRYVPQNRLLVCGSYAAMDSGRQTQCRQLGWPIKLLPEDWILGRDFSILEDWCDQVWDDMQRSHKCMIGVDIRHANPLGDPSNPARRLVEAVQILCRKGAIGQILVEGGETAYLLVGALGQNQFKVEHSSEEGIPVIVPLGMSSTRMIPKPGSYPWPDEFLEA